MPPKKTSTQPPTSPPAGDPLRMPNLPETDPPGVQQIDVVTERTAADIEDVLLDLGSAAIVRIRRIDNATGKASYAGQMRADEFSLEALTEAYGGGSYWLTVHNGREQIGGRIPYDVDPSIPAKNPRAPKGTATVNPTGNVATDALMAMMAASAQQSQAMMGAMGTMMQGVATAMTAMMQNRPQEKDPIETLRAAAEIMRPQGDRKGLLSEVKELMEISSMLNPNGGDGDGTMAMIGKGIEAVRDIARAAAARGGAANPPAARPTAAIPPTTGGAAPDVVPPPSDARPWHAAARAKWAFISSFIGKLDPATVADILEQSMSDTEWADLIVDISDTMKAGDPITAEACVPFAERTCAAFQIPPQHTQWMAELAKECLEIANDTTDTDDDAARSGS